MHGQKYLNKNLEAQKDVMNILWKALLLIYIVGWLLPSNWNGVGWI